MSASVVICQTPSPSRSFSMRATTMIMCDVCRMYFCMIESVSCASLSPISGLGSPPTFLGTS